MSLDEVRALLSGLSDQERRGVLQLLRLEYGVAIHPLEVEWKTTAEAILEAIHSAPDLTQRGVRGILAEATFKTTVVPESLPKWKSIPFAGEHAYDVLLDDGEGPLKVQVKNQRKREGVALIDEALSKQSGSAVYAVETQRTRNGRAKKGSEKEEISTRPYRFGEFDVLAVCMQPSTGKWTDFLYCATCQLMPRPENRDLLKVLQPIYTDGSHGWTYDFDAAAQAARKQK